jgi:hypothetical protein
MEEHHQPQHLSSIFLSHTNTHSLNMLFLMFKENSTILSQEDNFSLTNKTTAPRRRHQYLLASPETQSTIVGAATQTGRQTAKDSPIAQLVSDKEHSEEKAVSFTSSPIPPTTTQRIQFPELFDTP